MVDFIFQTLSLHSKCVREAEEDGFCGDQRRWFQDHDPGEVESKQGTRILRSSC